MNQEKNNSQPGINSSPNFSKPEMNRDDPRRKWIVSGLIASSFICLLIVALAFLSSTIVFLGGGPSTDPELFNIVTKMPSIAALISIAILFICVFIGWVTYRKGQVKLASVISLIIFLIPIFFCVAGCVAFFLIPSLAIH